MIMQRSFVAMGNRKKKEGVAELITHDELFDMTSAFSVAPADLSWNCTPRGRVIKTPIMHKLLESPV